MEIKIKRKEATISSDTIEIPAQGSANIPVVLENDSSYSNYIKEVHCGYYLNGVYCKVILPIENEKYLIPLEAFKFSGPLYLAVALVNVKEIIKTNQINFEVRAAPNGKVILPTENEWHILVKNYMDSLFENDYGDRFDEIGTNLEELAAEVQTQQEKITSQQTQIDNAIGNMGDYEIVQEDPVQIRFKKGDGTFGETVDLGDGLASKAMVNAGYYTYKGISYGGPASNNGIDVAEIDGAYSQETTNGYQLFDASKLPTKTQGGAKVTNNGDGSFTISGSENLTDFFSIVYQYSHEETLKLLKVGDINLVNGNSTTPFALVQLVKADGASTWFVLNKDIAKATITQEMLNDERCVLQIYIFGEKNSAIQAGTIKPMLYQDGDGTFESFTGGVASPNPEYPQEPNFVGDYNKSTQKYDIDFMTSGKNLFNINGNVNVDGYSKEQKTTNTVENGVLTCNVNSARNHGVGQRLYGLKGKTISVSAKLKSLGEATIGNIYIYESSGAYKAVGNTTALDKVFAINNYTCATDDIVVAFAGTGGTGVQFYDIMVNYGAKFVDYEPFTGFETTTVELNQPLRELPNGVKDTIENGVVTRRVGVVTFDGSEAWNRNNVNDPNNWLYYHSMSHGKADGLCNSLMHESFNIINKGADLASVGFDLAHNENNIFVNVGYYMELIGLANTAENLKTWLQSNPITVWYELATPTTEQITLPTLPSWYPYTNALVGTELQPSFVEWYIKTAGVNQNDLTVIKEDISQLQTETTQLNNDVTKLMGAFTSVTDLTKQLFLLMHRVGDIIFSTSDENPSTIYGGTWVAWGKGQVPVGVDTSDSDFNTVEKTGGSKECELRALIGAVGGNVNTIGYDSEPVVSGYGSYDMVLDASAGAKPQGASNTTRVVKSDGKSPTTVQPYITCYMWKRVS